MTIQRWLAFGLALGLAGCVDAPASPAATPASAPVPAPEPTVADETGSIAGQVLNDEELPVTNAKVALVESAVEAKSDESGRFTFNDLAPGSHTLAVERLGFESVSRKVIVTAGQVLKVRFVLVPLSLDEPYVEMRKYTAYVFFGESFIDIVTHEVTEEFCKPCHFWIGLTPSPEEAKIELFWVRSLSVPQVNEDMFLLVCKDKTNTTTKYRCTSTVASGYFNIRGLMPLPASSLKGETQVRLDVHAGLSIAYDQRVDNYLSLAYLDEFPEGHTALPPS